jgi:hypothetical protein
MDANGLRMMEFSRREDMPLSWESSWLVNGSMAMPSGSNVYAFTIAS